MVNLNYNIIFVFHTRKGLPSGTGYASGGNSGFHGWMAEAESEPEYYYNNPFLAVPGEEYYDPPPQMAEDMAAQLAKFSDQPTISTSAR